MYTITLVALLAESIARTLHFLASLFSFSNDKTNGLIHYQPVKKKNKPSDRERIHSQDKKC